MSSEEALRRVNQRSGEQGVRSEGTDRNEVLRTE
jgi:hypothetical protein